MRRQWSFTGVLLVIGGCANPEIVQVSPGTYLLARQDHGGIFGNKDTLKAGVLKDASDFAAHQNKVAIPVAAKEHPIGVLGDWASYELTFRLVDARSQDAAKQWVLVMSTTESTGGVTSVGNRDTYYKAKPADQLNGADAKESGTGAAPSSPSDRLASLKRLLDMGLISKEEYEAKRANILREL